MNVVFTDQLNPNLTLVGTANASPIIVADTYATTGNIPVAANVLANDVDPNGDTLAVTEVQGLAGNVGVATNTTATGIGGATGLVTLSSNGGFTYDPPPGFTGSDSFTYKVSDGAKTATVTATINITGMAWFINNAASGSLNRGTFTHPFTSLSAFNAVNTGAAPNPQDNHVISLLSSYVEPNGINLRNGQTLIGGDVAFNTVVTTPANSTAAYMTFAASTPGGSAINPVNDAGIDLASGNTVRGLSLGGTGGATGIRGTSFGTFTATLVTINTTGGPALDLTTGTAAATFTSVSSTASSSTGVNLSGVGGSLVMNGGALSGSTGTAFNVSGGNGTITYAGTISKFTAGRIVDVQTRAGGTITLSGAVTATGASTGINVSGATAASVVSFTGAVDLGTSVTRLNGGTALTVNHGGTASTTSFADLEIFTNGQAGLNASNGGTLNVTTGSVDAGRALNLDGLALGATFVSVVSSGSASEGVRLNNATGSLTSGTTTVSNPSTQGILVQNSSANVDFGATQVSGTGTQRILVTGATGNVTFAATTLTGGTDGVSLQNNSAGARTFALSTSGNTGIGFLHAVGGGAATVTGTTTITNPGGTGIDIQNSGTAVTFNGVTVNKGATAGTGVVLTSNTVTPSFGTLAITTSNGTGLSVNSAGVNTTGGSISATNGPAINATSGAFSATFATVSSTNSPATSLTLTNCSGTLTMNGGTLSGAASTAFNVSGGNATATYAGTITQNNAQRVVDVQGTTGNTISFTGTVTGGVSNTGVHIGDTTAVNGNVSFTTLNLGTSGARMANQAVTITNGTGTYSLGAVSIFTNNVSGLVATNADGTLNSTSGTVDATNATAISIDGPAGLTTLGMTLTTVNASSGANGIVVQDTNGSFSVMGTGTTDGTGGTIQTMTTRGASFTNAANVTLKNMNFTNAATTQSATNCANLSLGGNSNLGCNAPIHLDTVTSATLDNLNISGSVQQGINGRSVTNFVMSDTAISGIGDAADEDGIHFLNMLGTSSITNSSVSGSFDDNMIVQNLTGTTNLTISGSSFTNSTQGSGILFGIRGTSNSTINITGATSSTNNFSGGIVADTFENTTMSLTVTGCTSSGNNDQLSVSAGDNSNVDLNVNGNTLSSVATGDFVVVSLLGSAFDNGFVFDARIQNNNITVANGLAADGIFGFNAGGGQMNVAITGNTIDYAGGQRAIAFQAGQDGAGTSNVTITGNNIDIKLDGANNAATGIFAQVAVASPTGDNSSLCADIGGAGALRNTITHSLGGSIGAAGDIRVRQRFVTTVRLPGYGGANNDNAAVVSYLAGRNTLANSPAASATNEVGVTAGAGGFVGGAACMQPSPIAPPVDTDEQLRQQSGNGDAAQLGSGHAANTGVFARLRQWLRPVFTAFAAPLSYVKLDRAFSKATDALTPTVTAAEFVVPPAGGSVSAAKLLPPEAGTTNVRPAGGSASAAKPIPAKAGTTNNKPAKTMIVNSRGEYTIVPTAALPKLMASELIRIDGTADPMDLGPGFTLPAGESTTIMFNATIAAGFAGTSISNQATVTAAGPHHGDEQRPNRRSLPARHHCQSVQPNRD